jgi:taurine dioxygenase
MTASEQFNIEVVIPSIGAIIRNIDLSQPLTSDRKHALEQALYKHHVLFFPDQNLTSEQQRDFALEFGPIHVHPIHLHTGPCPEVSILEFGEDVNPNKKPGADKWHTDVSWSSNPPIIGMLYAKIIPKQGGGDTLWTNMVDIYKQEISNEMKHILSNLTAEHSMERAFKPPINAKPADIDKYIKAVENNPPVNHPVIREHPHTKEKYLYVNSDFTMKINELNQQESDLLLKHLFSLVTKRPEFMCRWKWSENDVCIWDERTTQHYATADYWPQHRKMHRCAITEREEQN